MDEHTMVAGDECAPISASRRRLSDSSSGVLSCTTSASRTASASEEANETEPRVRGARVSCFQACSALASTSRTRRSASGCGSYTTTSTPFSTSRPAQPPPMTPPPTNATRISAPPAAASRAPPRARARGRSSPRGCATARSTSCPFVAFTPRSSQMLSSRPTRTLPPTTAASATYGNCMRPMANAENTHSGGSWLTSARSVPTSSGAPYGIPMQSWSITGSSTRPSATSCFAKTRWPVSKISISGRTPRSRICRAIARSIEGVFVIT